MKVYYLTSSIIPSINANTINVISMCSALSKNFEKLNFFFSSKDGVTKAEIKEKFGISLKENVKLNFIKTTIFHEFLIFLISLRIFLYDVIVNNKPNLIICRNIYGSFFYSLFLKKIVYETHTVEKFFFRKILQNILLKKKNILTIAITNSLKNKLIFEYNLVHNKIIILPDGSFDNSKNLINKNYQFKNKFKIGYFGHLYRGRGIELILNIARKLPNFGFYIVGGDQKSYSNFKKKLLPSNINLLGYKNFKESKALMRQMDILLCPYQKQVYLKDQKTNTSSIMSPLKIFEYMSTKRVIISSNLNVLREVLKNNINCFLANPRNTQEWVNLITIISKNKNLKNTIAIKAYLSFKSKYSWDIRVKKLFKFLNEKKI